MAAGNIVSDVSLSFLICKELRLDLVRPPSTPEVPKDGKWGCGKVVFDLDTRKTSTPSPKNDPAPMSHGTLSPHTTSLGDQLVSLDLSARFHELVLGLDTTKGQALWGKG